MEREYGLRHDGSNVGQSGSRCVYNHRAPAGNDAITATYSGDSNHSGNTGTLAGGQQVNQFLIASPASLNFGSRAIGGSHAMLVAVQNVGAAKVTIGTASITSTGGDPNAFTFFEYCKPLTLKPGKECFKSG